MATKFTAGNQTWIIEHKYIVIHHTAAWTENVKDIIKSEIRRRWLVPYHYIIEKNWRYTKVGDLNMNVWGTRNGWYNERSVQIVFVWNYNNENLNDKQIETFNKLWLEVESKYWKQELVLHKYVPATSCPWKNINVDIFYQTNHKEKEVFDKYSWNPYWVTNYYTPSTINEYNAQNWAWDYSITANWHKLQESEAWLVIACPQEFDLWSIREIKTKHETRRVTCHDRWSAIKMSWNVPNRWIFNRIDLRQWYEYQWNSNWLKQWIYLMRLIK